MIGILALEIEFRICPLPLKGDILGLAPNVGDTCDMRVVENDARRFELGTKIEFDPDWEGDG